MNLIYFTKDAYKCLKKDLINNANMYYSDDPWLERYFKSLGFDEYYKVSSIVVPDISLMYTGDSDVAKNTDDFSNIRILYSAYKDRISPLLASDPMLWSALSHIIFKKYILRRWKKEDGSVTINQRFFASESRSSLCYFNAISRLWWSGYLTYDEEQERSDPYHLTKILLSAQQVQKDLFDQSFSMNKTVVKGLLKALGHIQEETKNACTSIFRECCDSYLNHYGAVSILDTLTCNEIEDIAYNFMKTHINLSFKR